MVADDGDEVAKRPAAPPGSPKFIGRRAMASALQVHTHMAIVYGRAASSSWWLTALRGALAVVLGIVAFTLPGITVTALVWLWGTYAVLDGVAALAAALQREEQRWWHFVEGFAGVIAGLVAFVFPGLTALLLLFLIAAWAIVTGLLEMYAALRFREELRDEWLLGLAGFVSLILGVALIALPGAGLLAMVWLVGAYAILFGFSMLALAFRERAAA